MYIEIYKPVNCYCTIKVRIKISFIAMNTVIIIAI